MLITNYRLLTAHIIQGIGPALSGLDKRAADAVGYMDRSQIVSTFHRWVKENFWRAIQLEMLNEGMEAIEVPLRRDARRGSEQFSHDWNEIGRILSAAGLDETSRILPYHLVIDEGQDLPKDFYRLLQQIDANVTVFADENQRIFDGNSSLADIRECLGIDRSHGAHELRIKQNYRNTRPVAEFASRFFVGVSTGMPELPARTGEVPHFVGFDAEEGIAGQIIKLAKPKGEDGPRAPKSVGVIVFDNQSLAKWFSVLRDAAKEAGDAVEVRCYNSSDRFAAQAYKKHPWAPDKPGTVTIVTVYTMKGLEWDDVIILPSSSRQADEGLVRQMQAYVAASRPRRRLNVFFLAPANASPEAEPGAHLGPLFSRFAIDPELRPLTKRYFTAQVLKRLGRAG
jgi:hypothetical protein